MKKITIVLLAIVSALTFFSCQKNSFNRFQANPVQTLTYDIKNTATAVTLSQATQFALKFLQQKDPSASISLMNAITVAKNGKPYFHIINANKGFVILSPDSTYVPILAYDSINSFSFADNDLNIGLKQWFNKHSIEIDFMRNTHNSYADSIGKQNKELWKAMNNLFSQTSSLTTTSSYSDAKTTLSFPT
ncbi:MAG: Spi family protease inhibitor, partial [Bacteroidetes bacterium]|nr:Spi family protease inhibitor [Bacteroidota bacterium]